jgi:hypothetical protein
MTDEEFEKLNADIFSAHCARWPVAVDGEGARYGETPTPVQAD